MSNEYNDLATLMEQISGIPPQLMGHPGIANAAGAAAAQIAHAAAQSQAHALNQSLQGVADAYAQQSHPNQNMHQMLQGMHVFGHSILGGPGMSAAQTPPFAPGQNWTYDPKSQRIGQMKVALELMNPAALEKYQPVIQLLGIHMVAPPILVQSLHPTTAHWQMEIEVNGKWIRHTWESDTQDGGDLPEWDANLGYLLDRVARIKRRGMEGEAVAPECAVAGDQVQSGDTGCDSGSRAVCEV
jgi:hypothetical protein